MEWLTSRPEQAAAFAAFLSVLAACWVAFYTVLAQRRSARDATYERIHEILVSPEVARGRRQIFLRGGADPCAFPSPLEADLTDTEEAVNPDLWDSMNQALAWYDTLGTYYLSGRVPRRRWYRPWTKDVVMTAWLHPLVEIRPGAYRFLDHRRNQGIQQPWTALRHLLEVAAKRSPKCRCSSCRQRRGTDPFGEKWKEQLLPAATFECTCRACKRKGAATTREA